MSSSSARLRFSFEPSHLFSSLNSLQLVRLNHTSIVATVMDVNLPSIAVRLFLHELFIANTSIAP